MFLGQSWVFYSGSALRCQSNSESGWCVVSGASLGVRHGARRQSQEHILKRFKVINTCIHGLNQANYDNKPCLLVSEHKSLLEIFLH